MNNKERKIYKNLEKHKIERVGAINKNKYGSIMIAEKYGRSDDVWVRFETGNLEHTTWRNFRNGNVTNPLDKTVCGKGFIGKGNYKTIENGQRTPQYQAWNSMLNRCYSEKIHSKEPTYIGCTVCEEWYNFQNFAKWYDENVYEIEGEKIHLDKDILIKGNKIYSPETCVFVPMRINMLFTKRDLKRGDLPIGVFYDSVTTKKYIAQSNIEGKRQKLGKFDTSEEAFLAYKIFKEKLIVQIADRYKNKIPNKLYKAMKNYKVEITD